MATPAPIATAIRFRLREKSLEVIPLNLSVSGELCTDLG
jgi:hypothetical protein